MDVLVVVEQLRRAVSGGIGTYSLGLLQGLASMGEDAPHLSLHASRPRGSSDPLDVHGLPVVTSSLPGPLLTRAWDRSLIGAPGAADVVHATSLAFPAPAKSPPLSLMVHDLAWREVPEAYPTRGRRWHEAALARAIAGAHLLVAPSRPVADALVSAGARADRVEIVGEGCDHLPPADLEGARAVLGRLGVDDGFLLSVGTLQPRKNLARLVEAYALARPRLAEPWPLVIVGPDGWGEELPSARVHGVVLAGQVGGAALAGLYRSARCLAFVPLVEGFGLPPLEAMRECTPVVSTGVPSIAGTGSALEVVATDVRAIADALVKASSDEPTRSALVSAGLERSRQSTWEAAARRHVELWREVAGS